MQFTSVTYGATSSLPTAGRRRRTGRQVAKYSTPSSEAVHPSRGELAQSSSAPYPCLPQAGEGGQNTVYPFGHGSQIIN